MHKLLNPVLARFAFFVAALAVVVMANLPDPPELPGHLTDKQQHLLAFVTLTVLAALAWPAAAAWETLVFLGAFGALIELLQVVGGMGRDPSIADWLTDMLGIALTLVAIAATRLLVGGLKKRPIHSGPNK